MANDNPSLVFVGDSDSLSLTAQTVHGPQLSVGAVHSADPPSYQPPTPGGVADTDGNIDQIECALLPQFANMLDSVQKKYTEKFNELFSQMATESRLAIETALRGFTTPDNCEPILAASQTMQANIQHNVVSVKPLVKQSDAAELPKFSGSSNSTPVFAYLADLEKFKLLNGHSDDDIYEQILPRSLSGDAYSWYMDQTSFKSWLEFRDKLFSKFPAGSMPLQIPLQCQATANLVTDSPVNANELSEHCAVAVSVPSAPDKLGKKDFEPMLAPSKASMPIQGLSANNYLVLTNQVNAVLHAPNLTAPRKPLWHVVRQITKPQVSPTFKWRRKRMAHLVNCTCNKCRRSQHSTTTEDEEIIFLAEIKRPNKPLTPM